MDIYVATQHQKMDNMQHTHIGSTYVVSSLATLKFQYCTYTFFTQDLCVNDYTTFPRCNLDDSICNPTDMATNITS